jgi:hypothetical protein
MFCPDKSPEISVWMDTGDGQCVCRIDHCWPFIVELRFGIWKLASVVI